MSLPAGALSRRFAVRTLTMWGMGALAQTVKELTAGSGLILEDAGEHELKGVPDRWHLYRVMK